METFLAKVRTDRDTAIAKIRSSTQDAVAKIRKEAFRGARDLAHRNIRATREHEARERDRYMYKVTAELKREYWTILSELRQEVLGKVTAQFNDAWSDPERQWSWCDRWLDTAILLARNAKLHVLLGAGTKKDVVSRIEDKLKQHKGDCSVELDASAPAGIVVSWPDHYLDGTLISHCQEVSNDITNQLAQIMSAPQPQGDNA